MAARKPAKGRGARSRKAVASVIVTDAVGEPSPADAAGNGLHDGSDGSDGPLRMTPEQVRGHAHWGPLLCGHIPEWDPCAQAVGCYFDTALAQKALEFFPQMLKHTEPPFTGQPFELMPWQASFVANLFGWRRGDGTRRFRQAFLYVPKKNGKSALAAGILLYLLVNAPDGSKLFGVAAAQPQAGILYEHAAGMIGQNAALDARKGGPLRCYGNSGGAIHKSVVWESRRVVYRVMCSDADTTDGVATYCAVIDELHRHASSALMQVIVKGASTQREPLILITTTADYNRKSACNDKLAHARTVAKNLGDASATGWDPGFLPAVWCADVKDDWRSVETWRKANPGFGTTVNEDAMREAIREVETTPSELDNLLRLNLNIVTNAERAWLDAKEWASCSGRRMQAEQAGPSGERVGGWREWATAMGLHGRPCAFGLDLSKRHDLSALVGAFAGAPAADHGAEPGPVVLLPFFWIPRDTMERAERRDRVPYSQWVREGFLRVTEGNTIDTTTIRREVLAVMSEFGAVDLAYDPWGSHHLALDLKSEGLEPVEFKQVIATFAEPMQELERRVKRGSILHGGHPVLEWNASVVSVHRDGNDNMKPMKNKSNGRIDGIVAAVMALGLLGLKAWSDGGDIESAYAEAPIYV